MIEIRKPKILVVIFSLIVGVPAVTAILSFLLPSPLSTYVEFVGLLLVLPVRLVSEHLVTIGQIGFRIQPLAWVLALVGYTVVASVIAVCAGCFNFITIERYKGRLGWFLLGSIFGLICASGIFWIKFSRVVITGIVQKEVWMPTDYSPPPSDYFMLGKIYLQPDVAQLVGKEETFVGHLNTEGNLPVLNVQDELNRRKNNQSGEPIKTSDPELDEKLNDLAKKARYHNGELPNQSLQPTPPREAR